MNVQVQPENAAMNFTRTAIAPVTGFAMMAICSGPITLADTTVRTDAWGQFADIPAGGFRVIDDGESEAEEILANPELRAAIAEADANVANDEMTDGDNLPS